MDSLYRRLVEFTGDGLCRYTFKGGRVLLCNQGFLDILELDGKPSDYEKTPLRDLMVYRRKEGTVRRLLERKGEIHDYDYDFETLKGTRKWVIQDAFVSRDEESGERVVEVLLKDITRRKRADEKLRDSEERYRAMMNALEDMVYICSAAYKIEYMNQALIECTGRDAVGEDCYRALHDRDSVCPWCVNDRVQNGESVKWEITSPKDDRTYYVSNTPVFHVDGTISKMAVIRDVTERRRFEAIAKQTARMEAAGALARGVSRSFSSILNMIRGHARAIADSVIPDTRPHADALRVLDATEHALDLAERLMQVAVPEASGAGGDVRPVSYGRVVRDTVELLRESFVEKGITIRVWGGEKMPAAYATLSQLADILMQLLMNAAQAMPDGGNIRISCSERHVRKPSLRRNPKATPGDFAVLSVADDGPGMSRDVLKRVFEPLFTTREGDQAFGLGLPLAQSIVQGWGGWIEVRTKRGHGSTFRIVLPKAEMPSEEEDEPAASSKPNVLLVDDDSELLADLAEALEQAGFGVITAGDEESALALFDRHGDQIAASVVDLLISGCEGSGVLEKMLEADPRAATIVTSGFSRDFARDRVPMGDWRYLQKPFDPPQLIELVIRTAGLPQPHTSGT